MDNNIVPQIQKNQYMYIYGHKITDTREKFGTEKSRY